MPIPPIIIPPHLLLPGFSSLTAGPGIVTGGRAAASGVYYGGSTLLASVLAANLWKNTPEWIKDDASWQSLASRNKQCTRDEGEEDNASFVDEMATLSSVISKLELLVKEGYERLGSQRRMKRRRNIVNRSVSRADNMQTEDEQSGQEADEQIISPLEWHAALLAYWQLCNQIRERYPEWRNDVYKIADSDNSNLNAEQDANYANERDAPINITISQIKELQNMLDYAIWAYEPNEEKLRSYLLRGEEGGQYNEEDESKEGGYQLIVHRTTSYIDPNESLLPETSSSKDNTNKSKKQSKNNVKRKPPGRVGYFVAISHEQQTMLIGIKGTSTLEELLTDCCGRAVRVDLDNDPHTYQPSTGSSFARCNDGVELDVDELITDVLNSEGGTAFENDTQLADNEKKEEGSSSVEELVLDTVHISTGKEDYPSESVEVELMNDDNQQSSINTSLEPSSSPSSTDDSKKQGMTSSTPTTKPSENVLLFPSHSRTAKQSQMNLNQFQPLELHQSPTDEFIETHGIEMEDNRSHKLRGAHEGILHCASSLLFEIAPLIEEYSAKGYKFICTGHSLGAGTAILLAVLIRGRYPILAKPMSASDSNGNITTSERVQAYAFASPPTLDRSSSLACSHYVTSIVFNSDIIPRSSLTNLDIFLTMLEAVRGRLEEVGMNPGSSKPKTNVVASTVALFRKLSEGIDGELLIEPVELQRLWKEAVGDASIGDGEEDTCYWDAAFGHHLFVPGKLLMMYEDDWSSPQLGSAQQQQVVVSTEEEDSKEDPDHQQSKSTVSFNAMWTNGTTIPALKRFDIGSGSGMATDHLTTSYERALALLLEHSDKYRLT